jgi:hypothetical protein
MKNANQRMLLWSVFTVLAASMPGARTAWADKTAPPQIASASQIFATSPTQLQIQGSGFGSLRPTVVLSGTPLFLLSFTDTMVFASVPVALPPGTYALVLTSGDPKAGSSAPFEVAIGAVGPPGATGPAGPQGPAGSMGPAGSVGAPGAAGPAGAQGPAGPVGPAGSAGTPGATGAQGPAGPVGPAGPAGANGGMGPAGAQGPAGPMGLPGTAGSAGPPGATGPAGPAGASGMSHVYTGSFNPNTNCGILGCYCPSTTCTSTLVVPAGSYLVQASVNLANFSDSVNGVSSTYTCGVVDGVTGLSVGSSTQLFGDAGGWRNLTLVGWSSTSTSFKVNCTASASVLIAMTATVSATQVSGIN